MAKCQIVYHHLPDGPPYYVNGGSHIVAVCQTHGTPLPGNAQFTTATCCPVGQIENAVEDGIARIEEAIKNAA